MNYIKFAIVALAGVIALAYFKLLLDSLSPHQLILLCRFMGGTTVAGLLVITVILVFKKG